MRVVVCALAKNEHLYINEWVNHYAKLGFDKIYLYDNDDIKCKKYIGDYIDNKDLVEIIDIRGQVRPNLQHDVYTEFYNTHTFDYCLFCDIDEFLVGINDIHEFLKDKTIEQIRIRWRLFGDDELIERDMKKPVMETFTRQVTQAYKRNLKGQCRLPHQGKAIVKGGLENVVIQSPHFASYGTRGVVLPSELPSGKPCWSMVTITEDYTDEKVYLNHYMTKSLKEFLDQKMNRTDAVFGNKIDMKYYWRINKMTLEKQLYIQKWLTKGRNL